MNNCPHDSLCLFIKRGFGLFMLFASAHEIARSALVCTERTRLRHIELVESTLQTAGESHRYVMVPGI